MNEVLTDRPINTLNVDFKEVMNLTYNLTTPLELQSSLQTHKNLNTLKQTQKLDIRTLTSQYQKTYTEAQHNLMIDSKHLRYTRQGQELHHHNPRMTFPNDFRTPDSKIKRRVSNSSNKPSIPLDLKSPLSLMNATSNRLSTSSINKLTYRTLSETSNHNTSKTTRSRLHELESIIFQLKALNTSQLKFSLQDNIKEFSELTLQLKQASGILRDKHITAKQKYKLRPRFIPAGDLYSEQRLREQLKVWRLERKKAHAIL